MTPASCAPGPSVEGTIWDAIASISAAVAGSSAWNAGGVDDFTASCACCCAAAMSAKAAIPTHCDSQSLRVVCMVYSISSLLRRQLHQPAAGRQQIHRAIWTLPHVPNALLEIG